MSIAILSMAASGVSGRADAPRAQASSIAAELSRLAAGDHVDVRSALAARHARSEPGSPARVDAVHDLATFALARGLLPEARSLLHGTPAARDRAQRRREALSGIVDAFLAFPSSSVSAPAGPPAAEPARGDDAEVAARIVAAARRGDATVAAIDASLPSVARLPPALRAIAAPVLAEGALEGREPALAIQALDLARGLALEPGARDYLRARADQLHGSEADAMAGLELAARARTRWGHAARLEIVDIRFRSGAAGADEALAALHAARSMWRGGRDDELALRRIEGIALQLGDVEGAVAAASARWRNSPAGPARDAAAARVSAIAGAFARGDVGETAPAALLRTHRWIVALAGYVPGYARASLAQAEALAGAGLPTEAARTASAVRERLVVGAALGLWPPPGDARLAELRRREDAWRSGGPRGHGGLRDETRVDGGAGPAARPDAPMGPPRLGRAGARAVLSGASGTLDAVAAIIAGEAAVADDSSVNPP